MRFLYIAALTIAALSMTAFTANAACIDPYGAPTPPSQLGLLGTQPDNNVQITGGCIDGTPIGQNTAASIAATGFTATGAIIATGNTQHGTATSSPAHIDTAQTTPPALTSCGTGSPTIVGTDTAGIVTMGTSASGCTITFNRAYVSTPFCVVSWIGTPLASQSYVTSAAAITLTQTATSGNVAQYICMGQAGD